MSTTKFPTRPLSFDELGGSKSDYLGVVDPTTDRSAEEVNAAFMATAMLSETPVQAVCQFSASAGPSIVPYFHRALWGSSLAVIPSISVLSTGRLLVSFPSSFTDDEGDTVDVNMKMGWAAAEGLDWNNKPFHVVVTPQSPNTFRVSIHDVTGTLTNAVGTAIGLRAL